MHKVHALGNSLSFHKFFYPVRVFKNELREMNLDIEYFSNPLKKGIEDCESLILFDDNYRDFLPIIQKDRKTAVGFLQEFLKKFPRIIWFDNSGSSGLLRSYIFPFIAVYAKTQLMRNVDYYLEYHSTVSPHREYVKKVLRIDDPLKAKEPISETDKQKLRISWNTVFKNWNWMNVPRLDRMIDLIKKKEYHFSYSPVNLRNRGYLIPYRVAYWQKTPTVTWWRTQTREKIEEVLKTNKKYHINPPGRVSKREFNNEIKNSIVTISPFGINEICYRDFECFVNGSLLFKASMEHINTWPDLFIDDVTYISHKWDFSDFAEKLDSILTHPDRYEEIAREGQNRFREVLSDGHAFAQHFYEMIY